MSHFADGNDFLIHRWQGAKPQLASRHKASQQMGMQKGVGAVLYWLPNTRIVGSCFVVEFEQFRLNVRSSTHTTEGKRLGRRKGDAMQGEHLPIGNTRRKQGLVSTFGMKNERRFVSEVSEVGKPLVYGRPSHDGDNPMFSAGQSEIVRLVKPVGMVSPFWTKTNFLSIEEKGVALIAGKMHAHGSGIG